MCIRDRFTHLAVADSPAPEDAAFTRTQLDAFEALARLAVRFFFTATGFFLLGELVRPGLRPRTLSPGVRRFLKKTGVLYAARTCLLYTSRCV